MVAKSKHKVLACSTPEHRLESPSRDSDSVCDSDAGSPVPFLCTQDGAEGETDVVWNFYTPKSERATTRTKNTTPVSRKSRRIRPKLIAKSLPKRKTVKPSQKRTELFQDLVELNQNIHELIGKKAKSKEIEKPQSCSEEDIFSDTSESSPKNSLRTSQCLRKNVLSSKFKKPEPENCLESDDSMNECLLKASQAVEENIIGYEHSAPKRLCLETPKVKNSKLKSKHITINEDSMDAIFNNIKLDSPFIKKTKYNSPKLNNDSFDNFLGDLNDSTLERLSQMPLKDTRKKDSNWVLDEVVLHGNSPVVFGRHNSMPESPSLNDTNKPSTSGMAFSRYSSMPFNKSAEKVTLLDDSPIRCTPDEIKKKHQQAREKLLAKRLLPFTASQQPLSTQTQPPIENKPTKKSIFQPRVASASNKNILKPPPSKTSSEKGNYETDIKFIIEQKRQEALMKLRKRQPK
ncbi:unnamed protein product [Leptosia nina]|uniref:Uncharacterized protein n=1 Tax=Leptosia nina TaxID=320188 RepID=A0AAV1JUL8_9NEOP